MHECRRLCAIEVQRRQVFHGTVCGQYRPMRQCAGTALALLELLELLEPPEPAALADPAGSRASPSTATTARASVVRRPR